jgi:hypothetical protein
LVREERSDGMVGAADDAAGEDRRQHTVLVAVEEALDEQQWRHVLELASAGSSPVEYSLVSSGRIQLRAHQYRRAAIDAATAVDVAVSDLLRANERILHLSRRAGRRPGSRYQLKLRDGLVSVDSKQIA